MRKKAGFDQEKTGFDQDMAGKGGREAPQQ